MIGLNGGSDDLDEIQMTRCLENLIEGSLNALQQGILMEKVFIGIGGDAQFREEGKHGIFRRGIPGQTDCVFRIEFRIRNADLRDADHRSYKTLVIQIEEFFRIHRVPSDFSTRTIKNRIDFRFFDPTNPLNFIL